MYSWLLCCLFYTVVDAKQEFSNKTEEAQASLAAREPRTGDPESLVLGPLSWVTCSRITCSALGGGSVEGENPMGSVVTSRVKKPWDHWAGSLGGSLVI